MNMIKKKLFMKTNKEVKTVMLENWHLTRSDDPYIAPELNFSMLVGDVYGHPKKQDGKRIVTSAVVESSGRFAITQSGTTYYLCSPSKDYRNWLKENYPNWDEENPLTTIIKLKER